MQFSPFGNTQDINPQVSDSGHQLGFSHGLIEGMLVRRSIDRQNKTDKLNESYNKKLMEMDEQDSRDRVLHAALTADKMRIDNQFAPRKAEADIGSTIADTGYKNILTTQAPAELAVHQKNANTSASNSAWDQNVTKNPTNLKTQQEVDTVNQTNTDINALTGGVFKTEKSYTIANKVKSDKELSKIRTDTLTLRQDAAKALAIKDSAKRDEATKALIVKATANIAALEGKTDSSGNKTTSVEELNTHKEVLANAFPEYFTAAHSDVDPQKDIVTLIPKNQAAGGATGTWRDFK